MYETSLFGIAAFGWSDVVRGLFAFAFYYPLYMAFVWMIGGLYFYLHWERPVPRRSHKSGPRDAEFDVGARTRGGEPPTLPTGMGWPSVSILVPCHDEVDNLDETFSALLAQRYPDFEVIAIDDGSSDGTAQRLDELAAQALAAGNPRLRVLHLRQNRGKATALRMGVLAARHEFLVCVDGDSILDPDATTWLLYHLVTGHRVGAVTGNPRIRTRSTLLGKLQVGEFSSIIGLIKRAQRIYGRVFTVSGVVAAFRKTALHRVGYWHADTVTDDVDVSWRLQLDSWDVRYEPHALCWVLMPETLRGLWRQRLRWAQGGAEAMLHYTRRILTWRGHRMWGVFGEYLLSVLWSYTMAAMLLLWLLGQFVTLPAVLQVGTVLPGWNGMILAVACLLQLAVSLALDSRYERGLARNYYWMVWYPLLYWTLNMATTVVALPRALLARRRQGLWTSPDRGIRPHGWRWQPRRDTSVGSTPTATTPSATTPSATTPSATTPSARGAS